jgi:hypothetical protein
LQTVGSHGLKKEFVVGLPQACGCPQRPGVAASAPVFYPTDRPPHLSISGMSCKGPKEESKGINKKGQKRKYSLEMRGGRKKQE